jgi:hypothetical protein
MTTSGGGNEEDLRRQFMLKPESKRKSFFKTKQQMLSIE